MSRRDCSLCEAAVSRLRTAAGRAGVVVNVVDVDSDATLADRYGDTVPVVLSDAGKVLSAGPLTQRKAHVIAWSARLGRYG